LRGGVSGGVVVGMSGRMGIDGRSVGWDVGMDATYGCFLLFICVACLACLSELSMAALLDGRARIAQDVYGMHAFYRERDLRSGCDRTGKS
jgi:hypothetical protein